MAVWAKVIGPLDIDSSEDGQNLFGPHLMKTRLMATRAGHFSGDLPAGFFQQFLQHHRTGSMHRRARSHFYGFQIQPPGFAQIGEYDPQELIYFLGHFLLDAFGCFFSC